MAKKDDQEYENKTGTELEILKNIEKAYRDAHGDKARRNTAKSMDWFRKTVTKNYSKVRTARMFRDRSMWKSTMTMGKMYMYSYDALHKDKLPIWDAFPLVIPFNTYRSKAGNQIILGINYHYLPPKLRMVAFRAMLSYRNEKRFRRQTRMNADWQVMMALSQSKYYKHAVHAYRADHVRSRFVEIPAQSWEMALFLPLARWQKGSKSKAWSMND